MRRIVLDLAVSLDGFIEGPHGETDWCILEEDMDFEGFLTGIDTILYGRVSYDTWGQYQPDPDASPAEQRLWKEIHSKQKVVFSRTKKTDGKAKFINSNITGAVTAIKQAGDKDIWLYGGANLISTFLNMGLIDVYRLSIHPVALGGGKPLFDCLKSRLDLSLAKTNVFRSGVVQLIYTPKA